MVTTAAVGTCLTTKLPKRQPFVFSFRITDSNGVGVDGLTVQATLFAGRSGDNPDVDPGVPVPSFNAVALQPTIDGIYEAEIDRFDPPIGQYIVVTNALRGGASYGHWEQRVRVVVSS